MMFETQKDLATKAVYAAIGAPMVATRAVREYGSKLADGAQAQLATLVDEGEKTAKKLQGGSVVEELQSRVDLEKVQDRVEKLRDQLEGALQSWRESFTPADTKPPARKVTVESAEPTPAAETTTTKTTTARTTTAKSPAAKSPAAKSTTTRKSTTKSATAKKPAATKTAAKSTTARTRKTPASATK